MKLILFDIDGTLLWTDGAGRRAIHRALLLEAGAAGAPRAAPLRRGDEAAQRAALLTGRTFTGADVVILGDTPEDVTCGRALGARALAVATGFYDVATLRAAGAARVFSDFANTGAVLDAIFAP